MSESNNVEGTAVLTDSKPTAGHSLVIQMPSKPLYKAIKKDDSITWLEYLLKQDDLPEKDDKIKEASSKQGVNLGRQPQPFNMRAVVDFQDVNPHHTACLAAKVAATVGLGFRRPEEIPPNTPIGQSDTFAPPDDGTKHIETMTESVTGPDGNTTKTVTKRKDLKPEEQKKIDEQKKKQEQAQAQQVRVAKLGPAPMMKPQAPPAGGAGMPPQDPNAPIDPNAPPQGPQALNPTAALVDRQKPSKCDEVLDPLCMVSWADVLNDVAEDYWQCGAGAIEVVRADPGGVGAVTGLHHIPISDLFIYIEDEKYNFHFEIESREGTGWSRRFCKWGDKEDFIKRGQGGFAGYAPGSIDQATLDAPETISEVIYIRRPSSKSRFYGYPDWLSAVTSVELVKALTQFKYDFFNNRGVPEFMLFLIGQKLQPAEWNKIEQSLRANIGQGNSHKSIAINIEASKDNFEVVLHKLAMDGAKEDDYVKTKEILALDIVTAHGVPPLLAGIQIPGKLGANNELPNSLMAFHVLKIGPAQRLFRTVLSNTLGSKDAKLGLTPDDFAMRTIPEEIDVGTLETVSRMRQDLRSARADGRPLDQGVKQ